MSVIKRQISNPLEGQSVRTELNKMLFIVLKPPQPAEVAKLTGQKQFAAYWRRPFQLLADSSINKLPSNI